MFFLGFFISLLSWFYGFLVHIQNWEGTFSFYYEAFFIYFGIGGMIIFTLLGFIHYIKEKRIERINEEKAIPK